ncbi:hypothetical protein H0H92_008799 [Tricholoma furcatifolium]|nr:hypothetical protein H0H92_008799 [Tricholoma furcatifolium]
MASSSRKKSIVSTAGYTIENPIANNTLLNKAASQSTSLYQQCSSLRTRLTRIRGFDNYLSLALSHDSTDPVTQLWDLFSFGIPLCYLFDCLPSTLGFSKINNSGFNQDEYEANPDKPKKRAIALFAMQIRTNRVTQAIPGCEEFTVTDLWDRNSTDGLVKVIHTITAIVDHLPPDAFEHPHADDDDDASDFDSPSAIANIIREMVETERKYVQDLEVMQKYANALSQDNIITQDTIHLLFPNLNKLLNFQRKFLIRFESTAEVPWQNQRWGLPFLECEDEFVVYEPYCANYTSATDLMLENETKLTALNHLINVKGELPAFLIKPIQRVCKYPLLLDSLVKAVSNNHEYQHLDELKSGSDAAKRITDKINEAQRRAENELTVKNLQSRIDDWKGHHTENFGELLLDDIFVVTKSEFDREYHVFLFEKIILCCKEALQQPPNGRGKVGKGNSLLKKQAAPPPLSLPGGVGQPVKKNTPLLLKGRIFLGNVTQASPGQTKPDRTSSSSNLSAPQQYPLNVWWKGDDDLEYFTLRCRREDQMRQWESTINRLIQASQARRANERTNGGMSRIATGMSPTITPPTHARAISKTSQSPYNTHQSVYSTTSSTTSNSLSSATSSYRPRTPYGSDEHVAGMGMGYGNTGSVVYGGAGPQGYPPHDGFDFEPDEDDFEEYPPSSYAPSGRGTPVAMGYPSAPLNSSGARRNNAVSMPPEREAQQGYERPRAHTEDVNGAVMAQWRNNLPPVPMPMPPAPSSRPGTSGEGSGAPVHAMRQYNPRLQHANANANANTQSFVSDSSSAATGYASLGASSGGSALGLPGGPRQRPALRSQFSSTKLKSVYDAAEGQQQMAMQQHQLQMQHQQQMQMQMQMRNDKASTQPALVNANGHPVNMHGHPVNAHGQPITSRSRSISQPAAYVPKPINNAPPPPLPTSGQQWARGERGLPHGLPTPVSEKRGSGSSQSTGGDSSDYSPNSSSPETPFGSNESSIGGIGMGMGLHTSRSQYFDQAGAVQEMGPPVKVKVHFHEDIFVIQVARSTEYDDLVERVGRKIRLCGPRRDDGPLRVKYKDEDGDMVSLGSTEDVQMAFEAYRPGGQVTLFVT